MPPKNPKKQVGKKRKKDSPPPDPDTDDSASGTEGETGGEAETQGNGDAEEDNIRLTRSAVHNEYNQTSESVEVKSKNGKKIKVTIRCCAHLLQLPIMKTLKDKDLVFYDLLDKVRKMVKKYCKSVNAKGELYELVQLHVVSYVVTRWWSDVDMMERLSRINKKDNRALNKVITTCDRDDDLVLSKDDFTLMEKFLALLKPIKKMADPTSSMARTTPPSTWFSPPSRASRTTSMVLRRTK